MQHDFGTLQYSYYDVDNISDGTTFADELFDSALYHRTIYYNAFYLSNAITNRDVVTMLCMNMSANHSFPIIVNTYYDWLLKTQIYLNALINVASYTFLSTKSESQYDKRSQGLITALLLLISFEFVPVGALIQDRLQTTHQQLVSGLHLVSYWIGNFIADCITQAFAFDTTSFKVQVKRLVALLHLVLELVLLTVSFLLDFIGSKHTASVNDAFKVFNDFKSDFCVCNWFSASISGYNKFIF